eukprot:scaffold1848_cov132-Skeletonema_menzelii.AAC.5
MATSKHTTHKPQTQLASASGKGKGRTAGTCTVCIDNLSFERFGISYAERERNSCVRTTG